jgi:hypothetical protein
MRQDSSLITSNQPIQKTAGLSPDGLEGLSPSDPRKALLNKPLVGAKGTAIATRGSVEAKVLLRLASALQDDSLSLRDLPPEAAQMILDSRAETMQAFFETWRESMELNASEDCKADKRRRLLAKVSGRGLEGHRPLEARPNKKDDKPSLSPLLKGLHPSGKSRGVSFSQAGSIYGAAKKD